MTGDVNQHESTSSLKLAIWNMGACAQANDRNVSFSPAANPVAAVQMLRKHRAQPLIIICAMISRERICFRKWMALGRQTGNQSVGKAASCRDRCACGSVPLMSTDS